LGSFVDLLFMVNIYQRDIRSFTSDHDVPPEGQPGGNQKSELFP
jgi:hypothetical protein